MRNTAIAFMTIVCLAAILCSCATGVPQLTHYTGESQQKELPVIKTAAQPDQEFLFVNSTMTLDAVRPVQNVALTAGPEEDLQADTTERMFPDQPHDPYAVLDIPAYADAAIYTAQVKNVMLELEIDYETADALFDAGYDLAQIASMDHEQRQVSSFVYANPRFGGSLDELLELLPQQAANILEAYPEIVRKQQYGISVQGRSLDAYFLTNCADPEKTIVLTFAIHGYEGLLKNDGAYLTESAYQLMEFYCQNPAFLGDTQLVICPMLNPDGVYKPKSSGYGRVQSQGVDMNRDFKSDRFKAQESRAFRDFLLTLDADILVDFHGWLNGTYGDAELADVFLRHTGLRRNSPNYGSGMGYLMGYAYKQGIQSLLVEHAHYDKIDIAGMIGAVNELCRGE